jgi:hypothetical protein
LWQHQLLIVILDGTTCHSKIVVSLLRDSEIGRLFKENHSDFHSGRGDIIPFCGTFFALSFCNLTWGSRDIMARLAALNICCHGPSVREKITGLAFWRVEKAAQIAAKHR